MEIPPTLSVSLNDVYVGASSIRLPGSKAGYVSVDTFGALNATTTSLGAGLATSLRAVSGVLVAGGSFTCTACTIRGNDFGVGGISVPVATASPYATPPSITLLPGQSDSVVAAKVVDIATDGSVDVAAEGETFARSRYAFADVLNPVVASGTTGQIDFGGGTLNSTGGNDFIGALVTEIYIKRRYETVNALDDTWNPRAATGQQKRSVREKSDLWVGHVRKERDDRQGRNGLDGYRRSGNGSDVNAVGFAGADRPRRRRRSNRGLCMTDILRKIYAAKAAVLEQERRVEPYEQVRARALARAGRTAAVF